MTLPGQFASLTWITMVATAETPAENQPLNGRIVGLRPADIAVMGSGIDNQGNIGGVRGYPRPGGTFGTEFVMTALIPESDIAAFNAIPAQAGWIVPASRTTWANAGVQLITTYSVPNNIVLSAFTNMYNAARAELVARVQQGLPIS